MDGIRNIFKRNVTMEEHTSMDFSGQQTTEQSIVGTSESVQESQDDHLSTHPQIGVSTRSPSENPEVDTPKVKFSHLAVDFNLRGGRGKVDTGLHRFLIFSLLLSA